MSNVFQRIVSMMKTSGEQNSPEVDSTIGAHRAIQVVFMWYLFGDDLLNCGFVACRVGNNRGVNDHQDKSQGISGHVTESDLRLSQFDAHGSLILSRERVESDRTST